MDDFDWGVDSVPCGLLPPVPVDDLALVRFYRRENDDDAVSQAIAEMGSDVVIRQMRQRHRAHTVALGLSPQDLHQRAELLELLLQEFNIPEVGSNPAVETDADRCRYFRAVALRLLEREVTAKLAEVEPYDQTRDGVDAVEQNLDNPNDWLR